MWLTAVLVAIVLVSPTVMSATINAGATKTADAYCGCDGSVHIYFEGCSCLGNEYFIGLGDVYETGKSGLIEIASGVVPNVIPQAFSYDVTDLCPGTYTYSVLIRAGILIDGVPSWQVAGVYTVTINGPEDYLDADIQVVNGGCVGSGSATVNVDGGNGGETYQYWKLVNGAWVLQSGLTTGSPTGLGNGTYKVRITDDEGCWIEREFTISGQSGPIDFTMTVTQPVCASSPQKGSICISNITGTTNYTITWSPSGPTNNATCWNDLSPGAYSVTVTDNATGCAKTKYAAIINRLYQITAETEVTHSGCGGTTNSGSILVKNVQGGSNYTYTWTPNVSSGPYASGLAPGTYTVVVRAANGCEWTTNVTITEAPEFDFGFTQFFNTTNGVCSTSVAIAPNPTKPGTPGYTYQWVEPSGCTGATCIRPGGGWFRVWVTDSKGCKVYHEVFTSCKSGKIITISPNPFEGDEFNVSYELDQLANVKFRLFKPNGDVVGTVDVGSKSSGSHNSTLQFQSLQTGTYYLNLMLDDVPEVTMHTVVKY